MPAIAGDYENMMVELRPLLRGSNTQTLNDFLNNARNKQIFDAEKSRLEDVFKEFHKKYIEDLEEKVPDLYDRENNDSYRQEKTKETLKWLCSPGARYHQCGIIFVVRRLYMRQGSSEGLTQQDHQSIREWFDIVEPPQQSFVSAHPYVTVCIGLGMVAAAYCLYKRWVDKNKQKEYENKQQPQMHGTGTAGAPVSVLG